MKSVDYVLIYFFISSADSFIVWALNIVIANFKN